MFGLDQRGVAPIAVIVIVIASTGAAVGVPVAVDVADVDPDHPLYALERFGERIRMIGDEDQMHERCFEGDLMYQRYGPAALRYDVFKEFVGKAEGLLAKPEVKERVKAWLESEERRVGVVTDAYDVDPDHALYEFEKKGEVIRKVESKDLTKERLGEFMAMVKKGRGKDYAAVMEEFRGKWKELVVDKPVDGAERKVLLEWMKERKHDLTEAQIELTRELLAEFKEDKIPTEIAELIKEKREKFEALVKKIKAATTDEDREAAIRELKKAVIEQIERFKDNAPLVLDEVKKCIRTCEVSYTVSVEVKIEIEIGVDIDVEAKFESDLASLENLYAQHKAEMPEKMKEIIENFRTRAIVARGTKAGLIILEELEDELETWKEVGKACYQEYAEKYAPWKEKIEGYLTIPECPEAIKVKVGMLREAVKEGDYEEAQATLEDLIAELKAWKPPVTVPVEIPWIWYPLPEGRPEKLDFKTSCPLVTSVGSSVKIEGTTEANVTVRVYVNGVLKAEVQADSNGNFSVSIEIEVEGTNGVEVSCVDLAGKESDRVTYGRPFAPRKIAT